MSALVQIEARVLRQLARGPAHAAQLKHVKPVLDNLVARGLAMRFPMQGSRVPLLVGLTAKGVDAAARAALPSRKN